MKWFANFRNNRRIELPEIEGWIEVRDELSIGEERATFAGAVKGRTTTADGGTRIEYDAERVSFGLVVAYITDWSARDDKDKPVPVSPDAIKALDPPVYEVIENAVQAHVEAMREAKKIPQRTTVAEATSFSAAS